MHEILYFKLDNKSKWFVIMKSVFTCLLASSNTPIWKSAFSGFPRCSSHLESLRFELLSHRTRARGQRCGLGICFVLSFSAALDNPNATCSTQRPACRMLVREWPECQSRWGSCPTQQRSLAWPWKPKFRNTQTTDSRTSR